jgi:hypothetical protein
MMRVLTLAVFFLASSLALVPPGHNDAAHALSPGHDDAPHSVVPYSKRASPHVSKSAMKRIAKRKEKRMKRKEKRTKRKNAKVASLAAHVEERTAAAPKHAGVHPGDREAKKTTARVAKPPRAYRLGDVSAHIANGGKELKATSDKASPQAQARISELHEAKLARRAKIYNMTLAEFKAAGAKAPARVREPSDEDLAKEARRREYEADLARHKAMLAEYDAAKARKASEPFEPAVHAATAKPEAPGSWGLFGDAHCGYAYDDCPGDQSCDDFVSADGTHDNEHCNGCEGPGCGVADDSEDQIGPFYFNGLPEDELGHVASCPTEPNSNGVWQAKCAFCNRGKCERKRENGELCPNSGGWYVDEANEYCQSNYCDTSTGRCANLRQKEIRAHGSDGNTCYGDNQCSGGSDSELRDMMCVSRPVWRDIKDSSFGDVYNSGSENSEVGYCLWEAGSGKIPLGFPCHHNYECAQGLCVDQQGFIDWMGGDSSDWDMFNQYADKACQETVSTLIEHHGQEWEKDEFAQNLKELIEKRSGGEFKGTVIQFAEEGEEGSSTTSDLEKKCEIDLEKIMAEGMEGTLSFGVVIDKESYVWDTHIDQGEYVDEMDTHIRGYFFFGVEINAEKEDEKTFDVPITVYAVGLMRVALTPSVTLGWAIKGTLTYNLEIPFKFDCTDFIGQAYQISGGRDGDVRQTIEAKIYGELSLTLSFGIEAYIMEIVGITFVYSATGTVVLEASASYSNDHDNQGGEYEGETSLAVTATFDQMMEGSILINNVLGELYDWFTEEEEDDEEEEDIYGDLL